MFLDAFRAYGRNDQFSRTALVALFDYYEQLEEETGEEIELDVVAICCDWSEFGTALEAAKEYGFEPDGDDADENEEAALDWLNDKTTVLKSGDSVVVLGF